MPLVPSECFSMSMSVPSRSGCGSGTPSNDGMHTTDSSVFSEPERLFSLRRWLVVGYCFPWAVVGNTLREISKPCQSNDNKIVRSGTSMLNGHFGFVPATEIQELDVHDGEGSLLLVWARSLLSDLLTERYCLLFNCGEYSSSLSNNANADNTAPPILAYFRTLCGCKSCVGPSSQIDADHSCMGCGSLDHGLLDVDNVGQEKCPVRSIVVKWLLRQASKYALGLDSILRKMCSKEPPFEEPTVHKIPIDKICSSAVQDVTRIHCQKRNNTPPLRSVLGLGTEEEQGRLIRRVWFIRKRMAENRILTAVYYGPGTILQQDELALYMTRLSIIPSLPFLAASELKVQYVEKQQPEDSSPLLLKHGLPSTTHFDVVPSTPCSTTSCAFPLESFSKPASLQKYPYQWKCCLAHNWPLSGDGGRPTTSAVSTGCAPSGCLYRHECAFCDEVDHGWSTCPKLRENPALRVAVHCLYINDVKSGQRAISAMHSGMDSVAPSDLSMYTTEGDSALVPVTDTVLEAGGQLPAPFATPSSTWSNPQFPRILTDMLGAVQTGTSGSCTSLEEAAARQLTTPAAGTAATADTLETKTPTTAAGKGANSATTPVSNNSGSKIARHSSYESLDRAVLRSRVGLDELAGCDSPLPNSPTAAADHNGGTNTKTTTTAARIPTREQIRMNSEVYKYCLLLEECRKEEHTSQVDKLVSALPFGGGEFARHLYWRMRHHWGKKLPMPRLPYCLHFNSPKCSSPPPKVSMMPCSSWWWCRLYCDHTCCGVVTNSHIKEKCNACDHHLNPPKDEQQCLDLQQTSVPSFLIQQCLRCGSRRHGWFSPQCRDYAALQQQLILMGVQSLHVLDHKEADAKKAESEVCSEDAVSNSEEANSGDSEYNSDDYDDDDDDNESDDGDDFASSHDDDIDCEDGEFYEDPDQALGDESSALNDDTPVMIDDIAEEDSSFSFDGGAQQDSYESVTTSDDEDELYKNEAAKACATEDAAAAFDHDGYDDDDDDAVHSSSADVDELAADWMSKSSGGGARGGSKQKFGGGKSRR